jgi:hypothetical protein
MIDNILNNMQEISKNRDFFDEYYNSITETIGIGEYINTFKMKKQNRSIYPIDTITHHLGMNNNRSEIKAKLLKDGNELDTNRAVFVKKDTFGGIDNNNQDKNNSKIYLNQNTIKPIEEIKTAEIEILDDEQFDHDI